MDRTCDTTKRIAGATLMVMTLAFGGMLYCQQEISRTSGVIAEFGQPRSEFVAMLSAPAEEQMLSVSVEFEDETGA